ncbi:hypothetical protein HAX54_011446, partial [Datura stramonium]|nr:hypothetical protein [Datura stramonium]
NPKSPLLMKSHEPSPKLQKTKLQSGAMRKPSNFREIALHKLGKMSGAPYQRCLILKKFDEHH